MECGAGTIWQDRYHATAAESGERLARCVVYVDLNRVRAGVGAHPREWPAGGSHEIQGERQRCRIVDRAALAEALQGDEERLAEVHREWIDEALRHPATRQPQWSESVAVGGRAFAERVRRDLGARARDRRIEPSGARMWCVNLRPLTAPILTLKSSAKPVWDRHSGLES